MPTALTLVPDPQLVLLAETRPHDPCAGIARLARDLNRLYRNGPAVHELDHAAEGFAWIDCHDAAQSIICFERRSRNGALVIVVVNFTPVPRIGYRIGLPRPGAYDEIFNSESHHYAGSDTGNGSQIEAEACT